MADGALLAPSVSFIINLICVVCSIAKKGATVVAGLDVECCIDCSVGF